MFRPDAVKIDLDNTYKRQPVIFLLDSRGPYQIFPLVTNLIITILNTLWNYMILYIYIWHLRVINDKK